MHPVSTHGAAKITMNTKEAEYQQRRRQAVAQGDGNPHIFGAQAPHTEQSSPANVPVNEPRETSGNVGLGTSATKTVSTPPDQFQDKALVDRMEMYRAAAGNAYAGMNDRSQIGNA